jgi:proteic killer suppression protein
MNGFHSTDGQNERRSRNNESPIPRELKSEWQYIIRHAVPHYGTVVFVLIESWRDRWLQEFFEQDVRSKKIPADLADRLFRKLQILDDATTDADLRVPPSNHFEKLKGNLARFHSIRVNGQWRLVFHWERGKATEVYLDDHSYR